MVLAPLLWIVNDRVIARWFATSDEPPPFDRIDDPGTPVIIAGFGRVGQIVGRVLNMRNIKFTAVDASPDHVDSVRRFGNKIYYGDATRFDLMRGEGRAGATAGRLRGQHRGLARHRAAGATELPQRENPCPRTQSHPPDGIARSRHRGADSRDLRGQRGTGQKLVLADLGEDAERIDRLVATFVAHDQEMLDRRRRYSAMKTN